MAEVVDTDVFQIGPRPDDAPGAAQVPHVCAPDAPRNDPGIARARVAGPQGPSPPSATAEPPAVPSCYRGASIRWPRGRCQSIAGTGSRSCGSRSASGAGSPPPCTETLPSDTASPSTRPRRRNSPSVRNRSRLRALYLTISRQGLVPSRHHAPRFGHREHPRQYLHREIGHRGPFAETAVQCHDPIAFDFRQGQRAERRQDMPLDDLARISR